jgi:hypothetical protein
VPRRLIGYDRYSSKAAYEQMARVYAPVRLYANFFQPVAKLIEKTRDGAKVKKRYDEAKTPYQRLLASGALDGDEHAAKREELARLYASLNPARLLRQIDEALEALWRLSDKALTEQKQAESASARKQTGRLLRQGASVVACG